MKFGNFQADMPFETERIENATIHVIQQFSNYLREEWKQALASHYYQEFRKDGPHEKILRIQKGRFRLGSFSLHLISAKHIV